MKPNVGSLDRTLRILIGAALLLVALVPNPIITAGSARILMIALALVPLLTGVVRICPLYTIAGISTRESSDDTPQA